MKHTFVVPAGVKLIALASILLACTAFAAAPFASKNSEVNWKRAETNYLEALKSDNMGVRQSAVTLIGKYRLVGASKSLITILQNEKHEALRMAAAYALVTIGSEDGIAAVGDAALYDGSEKVAKFCDALLNAANKKSADAIVASATE